MMNDQKQKLMDTCHQLTACPWRYWQGVKPNQIALYDMEKPITWHQLCQDINRAQKDLNDWQQDAIALTGTNDYSQLILMFAAWQLGITTLMLNPNYSSEMRQEILHHIDVFAFQHEKNFTASAYLQSDSQQRFTTSYSAFSTPVNRNMNANTRYPLTLTLTSGSTGLPKAIAHHAENHIASALGVCETLSYDSNDIWLLSLPIYHISGLAIIWRWLTQGACLKITPTQGSALKKALKNVTHASLVPSQLVRLLEDKGFTSSLSNSISAVSLRTVLLGGARIPVHLTQQAEQYGIQTWCGYGMTEMSSTISMKRANGLFSVGQILPYRKLQIGSNDDIYVCGETLAIGERVAGQLIPLTCNKAGYLTKDRGKWRTDQQDLIVLGRSDHVFQSGGENVQPEWIENRLCCYEGIEHLMIVPVVDPRWGQVPIVVISGQINEDAFLAWSRTQLLNYQQPKAVLRMPKKFLQQGIKIPRLALTQWAENTWKNVQYYRACRTEIG